MIRWALIKLLLICSLRLARLSVSKPCDAVARKRRAPSKSMRTNWPGVAVLMAVVLYELASWESCIGLKRLLGIVDQDFGDFGKDIVGGIVGVVDHGLSAGEFGGANIWFAAKRFHLVVGFGAFWGRRGGCGRGSVGLLGFEFDRGELNGSIDGLDVH